jgi:murein DD-endopeptidase MepM/ murein hydrolase activator NlpD
MKFEPFTLIVVPGPEAQVKRYRFGAHFFSRLLTLAALLVLVSSLVAVHLSLLRTDARENDAVREENRKLRVDLQTMKERLTALGSTVDRVARVDQNLRGSARLSANPRAGLAVGPTQDPFVVPAASDAEAQATPIPQTSDELLQTIEAFGHKAQESESSLQSLQAYFQEQRSLLAATPSIWPLRGAVTSDFGTRADPFNHEAGTAHSGLDVHGQLGAPVVAPSDGTVVFAALEGGYGNVVVIDHGHGIKTRYGHLSAFKVKPGQKVRRGEQIAAVGSTGHSTGPHLHYEVRVNGVAQNPRKFILEE